MITFRKTSLLAMTLALTAGMSLVACGGQPAEPTAEPMAEPATAEVIEVPTEVPTVAPMVSTDDIVTLISNDPNLSTLAGLLATAGLTETLKGAGPFTVFAPTNDAFAALPAGTLDGLTPEQVAEILKYHVVAVKLMAADAVMLNGQTASTLAMDADGNPQTFTVTADGTSVMINDATVTTADVAGANGVVHVIDKVLMPAAAGEGEMDAAATPAEGGAMTEPTAAATTQP